MKSSIKFKKLDDVNTSNVLSLLKKNNYVVVNGLFNKTEISKALQKIKSKIKKINDHPAMGEKPSAILKNYSKFVLGGKMNSWDYKPRCLRVMYNPIWDKDIYDVRKLFIRLAQFRNIIQGYEKNFAIKNIEKNLWTASRIQHYPTGGGFFSKHKDIVLNTVTSKAKIKKFLQIILLLTSKGKDFRNGGAFIIDKNKKKIDLEKFAKAGSILLYNGTSMHGVDEIDPEKKFSSFSNLGRYVMMASLYKFFNKDKNYNEFKKYFKN